MPEGNKNVEIFKKSWGPGTAMTPKVPVQSVRTANKQKRRDRILLATATIVCEDGVDAVRLAKVAEMAKVTVPTIHNLFGKKKDVFDRLIDQVCEWMLSNSAQTAQAITLVEIEKGVGNLFDIIAEKELLFKAGYLIGERFGFFGADDAPYRLASEAAIRKYQNFVDSKDLNGNLSAHHLGEFIANQFRVLRSDWIKGDLSILQFKNKFLWSFYIILMADAGPDLRKRLLRRINAVAAKGL